MIIPSKRAFLLLGRGMAIALFVAQWFNHLAALTITLGFDGLILGLVFLDGFRVKFQRVEISRHPLGKLSIGRDNPVTLKVRSPVTNTVKNTVTNTANSTGNTYILIRDRYPLQFQVSTRELKTNLGANSSQELTYTVHPEERGQFEWGDIEVRQLGRWGLAWHQWQVPQPQTVAVYPDLVGLRSLTIRLTLQSTGSLPSSRRFSMGTEFAELRQYTQGDDPRMIDWKATARHPGIAGQNPLQVRVLAAEREQTLIILLDRGRLMTARVKGLQRFDWGLNAALGLALAGYRGGERGSWGFRSPGCHLDAPGTRSTPTQSPAGTSHPHAAGALGTRLYGGCYPCHQTTKPKSSGNVNHRYY